MVTKQRRESEQRKRLALQAHARGAHPDAIAADLNVSRRTVDRYLSSAPALLDPTVLKQIRDSVHVDTSALSDRELTDLVSGIKEVLTDSDAAGNGQPDDSAAIANSYREAVAAGMKLTDEDHKELEMLQQLAEDIEKAVASGPSGWETDPAELARRVAEVPGAVSNLRLRKLVDIISHSGYSVPPDMMPINDLEAIEEHLYGIDWDPASRTASLYESAQNRFIRFCEAAHGAVAAYEQTDRHMGFVESDLEELVWYAGGNVFTSEELAQMAADMWQDYDDAVWARGDAEQTIAV